MALWRLILLFFAASFLAIPAAAQPIVLTFDQPETAGISGFRAHWDSPIPLAEDGAVKFVDPMVKDRSPTAVWSREQRDGKSGALAFDALNRSLLVRFPGVTAKVLEVIDQGYQITKIELVLPYRDTELWPPGDTNFATSDGYLYRTNWGVDELYRMVAPQWHAVAWALRRPWQSNEQSGPTFNAASNGSKFWTKYGASDEQSDRFPVRFGPAEVSDKSTNGSLDLTPLVGDPAFGPNIQARLALLECCGFIINKLEIYDARYFMRGYEWATATGGRAILIKTPKLRVHFARRDGKQADDVERAIPSTNPALIADESAIEISKPTAVMPSEKRLVKLSAQHAVKPDWMPEWQSLRINELKGLSNVVTASKPFYYGLIPEFVIDRVATRLQVKMPRDADVYAAWVDSFIGHQPRFWDGFDAAPELTQWFMYSDALPEPARDAFRRYWTGWLMPDRKAAPLSRQRDIRLLDGTLVHPQLDQLAGTWRSGSSVVNTYYSKTGDWQGNASFYRAGYTMSMSTQNFNHTASLGALLGGAVIGSKNAIDDGRYGWETYPLRLWAWSKGFSQENIDHYYFAITLSDQKTVADFGPTPFDRLMGEAALAKSIDELVAAYHPALRRFIAGSSRTSLEYLLAEQDGLQYILNTLSRTGTLHDVGNADVQKFLPGLDTVIGQLVPPSRVAMQATARPWAPPWVENLVDSKPIPYRAVAAGGGTATSYLGRHYGIATSTPNRRLPFMTQWRRTVEPVEKMDRLVTVVARYGMNDTRFANDEWGYIAPIGVERFLQHDNKVIMVATPHDSESLRSKVQKEGLRSLQSSIALFNYEQPQPTWEIYVDGKRITELPYKTHVGAKIAIRDGVAFFGVTALQGTDLGGGNVVVLREGTAQEWNRITFKPALVIESYNLLAAAPIAEPNWRSIGGAIGGFAIEIADHGDYPSFETFLAHLAATKIETRFANGASPTIRYESGGDLFEAEIARSLDDLMFISPKINNASPTLPPGILRDTTTSIQGTATTVSKLGAVLTGDEGRMKFIQVDPHSRTFVAWNPLPDLATFSLTLPNGQRIQADGRIGLARIQVNARDNKVAIDYAWGEERGRRPGIAPTLLLSGFEKAPAVQVNGATVSMQSLTVEGKSGYAVVLRGDK